MYHTRPTERLCFYFTVHAAVIAINEAIENQVAADTFSALQNVQAHLANLCADLQQHYQNLLYQAKQHKSEVAKNKVSFCLLLVFLT